MIHSMQLDSHCKTWRDKKKKHQKINQKFTGNLLRKNLQLKGVY